MDFLSKPLPGLKLEASIESWPISGGFTISRGTKNSADVIVASLSDGQTTGYGECVPYPRYGETPQSVLKEITGAISQFQQGGQSIIQLLNNLDQAAAKNAIDCAYWDFHSKAVKCSIAELAGLPPLTHQTTAFTISLASPEIMAEHAKKAEDRPLLKIKLGGKEDEDCMIAVREAVPNARLIADANEGWSAENIGRLLNIASQTKIELVEQPLPEPDDSLLAKLDSPIPICADESSHDLKNLEAISSRYNAINIKLDKTGGFSAALEMAKKAQSLNIKIMIGCMVGTSLSMTPAFYLSSFADWIDLDGPLLLKQDRSPGLQYVNSEIRPEVNKVWGY